MMNVAGELDFMPCPGKNMRCLLYCEERDCIVDFKIRKRSRMMYPGACSIEYQSIVQILLEILFGWDSKKQEGSCGILGTLDAYAVAHEEQGKFISMV